jgi:hypothetical protein
MDDAAAPDFALRVYRQVGAKLIVCSREHVQTSQPTLLFDELSAVKPTPRVMLPSSHWKALWR